jgi:hypothetical protein
VRTALAALGRPWGREAAAALPLLSHIGQAAGGAAAAAAAPEAGGEAAGVGWEQLWWPQGNTCDCCGTTVSGKVAVVCPECRVAVYCSPGCQAGARRGGAHPWEGCRLLRAWRSGDWGYVEGV